MTRATPAGVFSLWMLLLISMTAVAETGHVDSGVHGAVTRCPTCRCERRHACTYRGCNCDLWAKLLDPERDRVFPILGNLAREAGYDIPLPHGMGVNVAYMDQGMDIESLTVSVAGGSLVRPGDIRPFRVQSRDTNVGARYDLWLLPCLNVYGLYGHTQGSAVGDVTVSGVPGLAPDTVIPVRIDYDGPTYGGGWTAAMGYENFFAVLDWNYTETDLPGVDTGITARTLAPRVGLQQTTCAAWVGAFYTNVDKELSATVDVTGIPVRVLTELDVSTDWNFIYGLRWAPNQNWEFVVEHGFGGRNQIIGAATIRF